MNIKEIVTKNLKEALKAKREEELSTLRMLIAAIRNKEIEKKGRGGIGELSNEELVAIVRSETKKRRDAIESFRKGDRIDLAKKEMKEQAILEKYLPDSMSDGEIEKLLLPLVVGASARDFGRVMGAVMKMVNGRASGDQVSAILKRLLH